jgi:hypothetical protein
MTPRKKLIEVPLATSVNFDLPELLNLSTEAQ